MNIENALRIHGWMEPEDLVWLANQAAKHEKIVEVGCWLGRSTRALADNTRGVVFAVDTWNGSDEDKHREILKHTSPDWLYKTFLMNIVGLTNIFHSRFTSIGSAATFSFLGLQFDMVFIDASHDYESVKADILAWRPLVVSGGILCGHDAGSPPITQATHELLPDVRHEGSMWVVNL